MSLNYYILPILLCQASAETEKGRKRNLVPFSSPFRTHESRRGTNMSIADFAKSAMLLRARSADHVRPGPHAWPGVTQAAGVPERLAWV